MRLRWASRWVEAPCYAPTVGGVVVEATRCEPVARVRDGQGGRVMDATINKVAVFTVIEGPRRTFNKVRAKLEQRRYLGSWSVTLVQGRRCDDGRWVVALAPCAPEAATHFLVPEPLVRTIDAPLDPVRFGAVARRLRLSNDVLEAHGHERYLHSGNAVPTVLRRSFEAALGGLDPQSDVAAPAGLAIDDKNRSATVVRLHTANTPGRPLALLGGGDYARIEIMPALRRSRRFIPYVVADREPQIAVAAAERFGFRLATTDALQAIELLPRPGVVMVATTHDSHAHLGAQAALAGHAVFVEKPAVVTYDDLELLVSAWLARPGAIEIGFNRRWAPLTAAAMSRINRESGPTTVTCTVREVPLKDTHWFLWPNQGTRVAGNLCHWLDLGVHMIAGRGTPAEVRISPPLASDRRMPTAEERSIAVSFSDGSLLTVLGTTRGDATRGVQEAIEVRRGATTLRLDDFRTLHVLRGGRHHTVRTLKRDKGHTNMYARWSAAIGGAARGASYPLHDLLSVCLLQLAAAELVRNGEASRRVHEDVLRWRDRTVEAPGDAPEGIRTPDLRFRRPTLYPAELLAQDGQA